MVMEWLVVMIEVVVIPVSVAVWVIVEMVILVVIVVLGKVDSGGTFLVVSDSERACMCAFNLLSE